MVGASPGSAPPDERIEAGRDGGAGGQPRELRLPAVLLRFVSCGVLSVVAGGTWRLTHPSSRVTVTGALADVLLLLAGFAVGGTLWLVRDVRVRRHHPDRMSDERLVFSLVVFAAMPIGVLVVLGAVWLLSLVIGAR